MAAGNNLTLKSLKLDPTFEAKVLNSGPVASMLNDLGKRAVPEVRKLAPERLGFLRAGVDHRVEPNPRRRALVLLIFNSDFKAGWYEFGTARTPARPSLRPGTEAAIPGLSWEADR